MKTTTSKLEKINDQLVHKKVKNTSFKANATRILLHNHLHVAIIEHVENNMLDSHHQDVHVELPTTVIMKTFFFNL